MTKQRKQFSRSMRMWAGAAVMGLATLAVCASGGPAGASRGQRGHDRHAARGAYVALGDSVTFGYSPLLEDPWVPEQFVGYPEIVAQWTGRQTTNLGCPGQTAQALVSLDADDAGCFEFRAAAAEEGIPILHADYSGTQLEAALDAVRSATPPRLISVQGGGNELLICLDADDVDACLADTLPKVTASLHEVVTQLRDAGYRGRMVLVGYYLVPDLEPQLQLVNDAIAAAAHGRGVAFAEVARPFARYAHRHGGGDICETGLLVVNPDGSCDIHPSRIGQELIAKAVLAAGHHHACEPRKHTQ